MLINFIMEKLLSCDVEYGNATAFYSATKTKTLPYSLERLSNDEAFEYEWNGVLVKTDVHLKDEIALHEPQVLSRRLSFYASQNSCLFDMVSRFVVISYNDRPAKIAGREFKHQCANLYRQYAVKSGVRVPIGSCNYLEFESLNANVPDGFQEVFYIRDESKNADEHRWIVHHRLIVDPSVSELILRSCNPRFEGPLIGQGYLPRWFKRLFFRIRESKYPNLPIMTIGEVDLLAGKHACLHTGIRVL